MPLYTLPTRFISFALADPIMLRFLATISFALAATTALAQNLADPTGTWEISTRDSRYAVELCGEQGTHLCGTLVWLGRGANTPDNAQYMNSMIIDHARPNGKNQWRGELHLFGHSATGTIKQTSNDRIELRGCAFFVICRTYDLLRFKR